MPHGFALAIRQHVRELQVDSDPQVEWNWRFTVVPGGVGVHIRIPGRQVDKIGGWDLGKEFISKVPADAEGAQRQLSKWFEEVHTQFRLQTGKS